MTQLWWPGSACRGGRGSVTRERRRSKGGRQCVGGVGQQMLTSPKGKIEKKKAAHATSPPVESREVFCVSRNARGAFSCCRPPLSHSHIPALFSSLSTSPSSPPFLSVSLEKETAASRDNVIAGLLCGCACLCVPVCASVCVPLYACLCMCVCLLLC